MEIESLCRKKNFIYSKRFFCHFFFANMFIQAYSYKSILSFIRHANKSSLQMGRILKNELSTNFTACSILLKKQHCLKKNNNHYFFPHFFFFWKYLRSSNCIFKIINQLCQLKDILKKGRCVCMRFTQETGDSINALLPIHKSTITLEFVFRAIFWNL